MYLISYRSSAASCACIFFFRHPVQPFSHMVACSGYIVFFYHFILCVCIFFFKKFLKIHAFVETVLCDARLLCIHRSDTLFSHKMCARLFIYIYIILNIYLYHIPPRTTTAAAAMEHHYYIYILYVLVYSVEKTHHAERVKTRRILITQPTKNTRSF